MKVQKECTFTAACINFCSKSDNGSIVLAGYSPAIIGYTATITNLQCIGTMISSLFYSGCRALESKKYTLTRTYERTVRRHYHPLGSFEGIVVVDKFRDLSL